MSSSVCVSPALVSSQASRLPAVDLYGAVHRGLRWSHAQLMLRLGTTSPADGAQTQGVLLELGSFLELCIVHLSLEDRHYHPALERRSTGSAAALSRAHLQHYAALTELRLLLHATGTDAARWRGLYLAYASFVAADLLHMAEEETLVQPMFEELYSAAELRQLNEELVADIPPADKLSFLRIMIPAATREDRVAILEPIRATIPAGPFAGILNALRPTLSEADFEALTRTWRAT